MQDTQYAIRNTPHSSRLRSLAIVHCPLFIILLAYLTMSLLYGVTIPIFETPDAGGHYAYIHELTEGRGLPVQGTPSGRRVTGYVASHPPLYYALSATLTFWVPGDADFRAWAWENPYVTMGDPDRTVNKNFLIHTSAERFPWQGTPLTMHIARLVSTALGTLAVVATYGAALELFPGRRWFALGAAFLTAFTPMLIFTSARVSNDAAVTAFGSLVIWGAVRLAVRGISRKGLVLTGAALGLAVLSKLSGVVLAPAVALALLLDALRNTQYTIRDIFRRPRLKRLLVGALLLFGSAALICGWWFVRNLLLYGELMGVEAWLSHTGTVRSEPIGLLEVIPELGGLEKSYWAMFGWFNIPVAPWMYRFWWVIVRAALVGLLLVLVDQWMAARLPGGQRFSRPVQAGLLTLASAFLLVFGSVWRFIMIVLGSQGRYLMPAVASISILLMLGLRRLLQSLPRRLLPRRKSTSGLAVFLGGSHIALALICLFAFIRPAYAPPDVVQESQLPEEMERFGLVFDGTPIKLIGGVIEPDDAHPGDSVPVEIYWRATAPPRENIFNFVQVLGRDMEAIAGVDCYPGRGNFPPTLWEPGVIYRDRYHLRIPEDARVPTIAALQAGLYMEDENPLTMRRAPDYPPLDMMLLDLMALRPKEPLSDEVEHPVGARLGDAITLVGYDLSSTSHQSPITVTLVWNAEASLETNYTAFVHLLDEDGDLVAQSDELPLDGDYRTTFWAPGDVVRDPHRLALDESESVEPEGSYTLLVGMYNSQTGERLPAYDKQGNRFPNDAIIAAPLKIK